MIDEKKLINYIKADINPYGKPFNDTAYEFGLKLIDYIEAMEKQPQVGGWIPVTERLPEDCEEDWVLVQIKEKDGGFLWIPRVGKEWNGKWWLTDDKKPLKDMFQVVAWQPLPEPFTASEEE